MSDVTQNVSGNQGDDDPKKDRSVGGTPSPATAPAKVNERVDWSEVQLFDMAY